MSLQYEFKAALQMSIGIEIDSAHNYSNFVPLKVNLSTLCISGKLKFWNNLEISA